MTRHDALTDAHDHLTVASARLRTAGFPVAATRVDEEASRVRMARLADGYRRGEIVPPVVPDFGRSVAR